jgi:hypothetical protein
MPTEHFNRHARIEAWCVQAVDNGLMVRLWVINEIVDDEGVALDINNRVVLGVKLPVAVIIVYIE